MPSNSAGSGFSSPPPSMMVMKSASVPEAKGLGLAALSGLLMFSTQPTELLANRMFTVKIALMMLAACNAGWFHARRSLERQDAAARASLLLSTVLWLLVITCGRWIGYW